MQSQLAHLQVNVQPTNMPFYKDLFTFLGWKPLYEDDSTLGVGGKNGASLWFSGQMKDAGNDYDGPGVNHLGIGTESQADIDAAAAYLTERGVPALFETPRHRPEFAGAEDQTYYQVMFESPDRVLFEIVYTGPKSA